MLGGTWHGTTEEALELRTALARNCTCAPEGEPQLKPCGAHALLLSGQDVLDHLVYGRRLRARWLTGEGIPDGVGPLTPLAFDEDLPQ